jgi:hypothetical protein
MLLRIAAHKSRLAIIPEIGLRVEGGGLRERKISKGEGRKTKDERRETKDE